MSDPMSDAVREWVLGMRDGKVLSVRILVQVEDVWVQCTAVVAISSEMLALREALAKS